MRQETPLDQLFDAIHAEQAEMRFNQEHQSLEAEHIQKLFETAKQCLAQALEGSLKFQHYLQAHFKPSASPQVVDRLKQGGRHAPYYLLLGLEGDDLGIMARSHPAEVPNSSYLQLTLVRFTTSSVGSKLYHADSSVTFQQLTPRQKHELGKFLLRMQTPEDVMKVLIELFERKE